jgi:hypothetical protein
VVRNKHGVCAVTRRTFSTLSNESGLGLTIRVLKTSPNSVECLDEPPDRTGSYRPYDRVYFSAENQSDFAEALTLPTQPRFMVGAGGTVLAEGDRISLPPGHYEVHSLVTLIAAFGAVLTYT